MPERAFQRRPAARPPAEEQGALAPGPRHERLMEMAAALNAGPRGAASGAPIQLTQIRTGGGVWDDHGSLKALGPGIIDMFSSDSSVGAEISLDFTPGRGAPFGDGVGLIQSVHAQVRKTEQGKTRADPTGFEAMPLDEHGRAIDRGRDDAESPAPASPLYGVNDVEGHDSGSLADTPEKSEGTAIGRRRRFSTNLPAKLWDKPSSDYGNNNWTVGKSFETTAVVLEGEHKGDYLGSVRWGYEKSPDDKKTRLAPALVKASNGQPTDDFLESASRWNAGDGHREGDPDRVPIPIPHGWAPKDEEQNKDQKNQKE
jgi:hypothetical protein